MKTKKKQTCLLVRFANYCPDPTSSEFLIMLNALKTKICGVGHNKKGTNVREFFECKRFSGSSGLTCVNSNFFKAFGSKKFLPRATKACKIIKTSTQFLIYYKRVEKNKKKELENPELLGVSKDYVEYKISQPQIGGKTSFDTKLLQDFPWFVTFTASKFTAAMLMDFVNKSENVCVEPDVITVAFNQVNQLHELSINSYQRNRRLKVMSAYATRQNISVVGYPCCFHQDYTGTIPSLENKKCFEVKLWSNKGVGRGGGAPGTFVIAFLDWTSHKSGSRRQDYLTYTGLDAVSVPRVTERMWINHFGFSYDRFRNSNHIPSATNEDDEDD